MASPSPNCRIVEVGRRVGMGLMVLEEFPIYSLRDNGGVKTISDSILWRHKLTRYLEVGVVRYWTGSVMSGVTVGCRL